MDKWRAECIIRFRGRPRRQFGFFGLHSSGLQNLSRLARHPVNQTNWQIRRSAERGRSARAHAPPGGAMLVTSGRSLGGHRSFLLACWILASR